MPAFKFKLAQCVTLPSDTSVQGRVSARTEFVTQPNIYQIVWLDAKLAMQSAVFTEAELEGLTVEANPALPDVEFAAAAPARKSRSKKRSTKR
jgi:hypothetical protein